MKAYPVFDYEGFAVVVNPLEINGRYFATFSIHKGGANQAIQLPVAFQVGHSEAPSFELAQDAIEDASASAKLWIDAQGR